VAKQIIILGSQIQDGSSAILTYAFWFPITSGQQKRDSGSAWPGASVEENAAIQSGDVLEELGSYQAPRGGDAAVVEGILLQLWTNRNAEIAGKGPASFAGMFYDDATGWGGTAPPTKV
jgi:hypothetical protein